jgi:hypothetical protein
MKIELDKLSKQEKKELLSELLNDPDTLELSEAEFQDRIKRVVQRLYDAVEEYLKEVDKIRAEERTYGQPLMRVGCHKDVQRFVQE